MHDAIRPQSASSWCSASKLRSGHQRLGAAGGGGGAAWPGSGNGDPCGLLSRALGRFRLFRLRPHLPGRSWAAARPAAAARPPDWDRASWWRGGQIAGIADDLHRNRGRQELVQCVGDREHRRRGPGPKPSRGSCSPVPARSWRRPRVAPSSSWTCRTGGADLNMSKEGIDEQPARVAPATAIAMTRRMIHPSIQCG